MALRTTPFYGAVEQAQTKRSGADAASKSALIVSALLATLALVALVITAASVPSKKHVDLVQIGVAGDPIQFPEYQDLCLSACKHSPYKLEKCNAGHLSTFYLDYQSECEKKPSVCHLSAISCGGMWRPEQMM